MNEPIQVSARTLGQLAQHDFCARCLWIRSHCGDRTPYTVFPGIFSSIDKYSKGVTAAHFEKRGAIPTWFNELGDLGAPMAVPHWSRFRVFDDKTGITLSGMPDEMIRKKDGSVFIVDYKTARFTDRADALLPLYVIQLPVPPTPDNVAERIRFYWRPPSERQKQDDLTSQFYLIARGNGMYYLGHKNFYQFHLHLIPKDVYEAMKRDVLWRWKQIGISHLVGETRVEHPDEDWLLDDPEEKDNEKRTGPRRAPQARKVPASNPRGFHPKDFHLDSGTPCWCWRDRFGIPF